MTVKKILLLLLLTVPLSSRAQEAAMPIIFSPQSPAQAQFAGYYVALEQGFYAEEGLDVTIVHPFVTQSPVDNILKGSCQVSMLTLSQAMGLVDKGFPLVNILQTSMNSATLIISRWGEDPLQLKGAKVAAFRTGFGQQDAALSGRDIAADLQRQACTGIIRDSGIVRGAGGVRGGGTVLIRLPE